MGTQHGNNNPYNQDNETAWIARDLLKTNQQMVHFFQKMVAFRKAHPGLGRSRFWKEDVRWYGITGTVDLSEESRSPAFCLHGASQFDVHHSGRKPPGLAAGG